MSLRRCSQCDAELLSEARFCRQCGAGVVEIDPIDSSEMPTAVLGKRVDTHLTQRLDPRPTTPERGSFSPPEIATSIGTTKASRRWLPATLILGLVFVIVIGIASAVAYVSIRNESRPADSAALIYPGARVVADLTNDGGRAMHLQTEDSLDRVAAWYDTTLKPTKTMRLTSTNVVLKNQNVTATIATESGKTNILLKQLSTP